MRLLRFGVLPLAAGAGIGLGAHALLGFWAVPVIVVGASIYLVHLHRWLRRTEAEMKADWERWREMTRQ